ncbi:MAG: amidase [Burkholderiaceae bacterium]
MSSAIGSGEVSSVEVLDACLARTDALDPALGSFVSIASERARERAAMLDRERAATGSRGPLHGIPLGIKDNIDVVGLPTTGNSRAFVDRMPGRNATVVDRLEAGGAVIVGKLATFELAIGGPTPELPWPLPRNPWDLERSPGGSSSDAGAALAARLVPGALGTDTGGSIRGPASLCGLSGLVPSDGLVSRHGIIPTSFTFDRCGPMARTAEDCALLLDAIVGHDPADKASIRLSAADFHASLRRDLKGLRIGVVRHYWEHENADRDVNKAMEESLSTLRDLGARVGDAELTPFTNLAQLRWIIAQTETFNIHLKSLQQNAGQFGHDFLQRVLPACLFSGYEYVQALREWDRALKATPLLFKYHDVLVTTALAGAPRLADHDPLQFLRCNGRFLKAVTPSGPSAVFCNGFDAAGLPLGMEVSGRPLEDGTVLSVGHAFQGATTWHRREPRLAPDGVAPQVLQAARQHPPPLTVDAAARSICHAAAERAGLRLNEDQMQLLYRGAPFIFDMVKQLDFERTR